VGGLHVVHPDGGREVAGRRGAAAATHVLDLRWADADALWARARAIDAAMQALLLAGADTGRLRASIHVELTQQGGTIAARIGSNVAYAYWHHEGHGPLRPVRARVMVFDTRGR
jgi:hypothetical protein